MNLKCCFCALATALILLGCSSQRIRSEPPLGTVDVLVPGDRFYLVSQPEPSRTSKQFFTVDEKGNVVIPLLGTLNVAGMAPSAATEMLKKLYVERGFKNEAPPIAIEVLSR
jgi:protein involved in polysaccharide export with SLBB domain